MPDIDVDDVAFDFPQDWIIRKYDGWRFYRDGFSSIGTGVKAVDLLAVQPDRTIWLVEVKDYRVHPRTKPSELSAEVADKVVGTLSAMLPCKLNGRQEDEKDTAGRVLAARRLRVVLHLEQPAVHSKLRPRAIDAAALKIRLKQMLRAVDSHPAVTERAHMGPVPWTIR